MYIELNQHQVPKFQISGPYELFLGQITDYQIYMYALNRHHMVPNQSETSKIRFQAVGF
jgi:hypothetical protein